MSAISSLSPRFNDRIETLIGNPESAKIILLGDIHTDKTQIKLRRAVLDRFARPGDMVLCEGRQRYVMLNPDFIPETKGRRDLWVLGWDDVETVKEANRHLAYQMDILNEMDRKSENGTLTPFSEEIGDRAAELSFKTTLKNFDLGIRNEWMLEAIDTMSRFAPDQKIFVISGAAHFDQQQLTKILKIDLLCLMIFTQSQKAAPDGSHLEKICKQTKPSLKDHLIPIRDAVGPLSLLSPPNKHEDVRNLSSVNDPKEQKTATPLPTTKK